MFYTYVLFSQRHNKHYVGSTANLIRRLAEHRNGKTKTTAPMTDAVLVYYEAGLSEKDATSRERQLKTGFGRAYLKRRLRHSLGG